MFIMLYLFIILQNSKVFSVHYPIIDLLIRLGLLKQGVTYAYLFIISRMPIQIFMDHLTQRMC